MKRLNSSTLRRYFLLLFTVICFILTGPVTLSATEEQAHGPEAAKEFNAGEMIVDHIIDHHEWHILDFKGTHVSIPLPVILWYNGRLDVFSSARFHQATEAYKGYKIETEGENKNKIVRTVGDTLETDTTAALPLDFSITKNVLALFFSVILLLVIFLSVSKSYRKRGNQAPKGLQSLLEPVILFIRDDVAIPSIGERRYARYMPYLLTLFFFIFFSNLMGLIPIFPGGANLTGNIAVTLVMAVFTFIITTFSGNKSYWTHIVNTPGVPWWLKIPFPLMPFVELIGVFTKPIVLMIRLFANMMAGHIVMLGFISLIFIFGSMNQALGYGVSVVSVAFAIFMNLLELLVAFIQAFVFTLLSALYFGMASEDHGHEAVEASAHH